ncbi:hypothetical protein OIU84_025039 [Salix udensis]|uniref:Uncharacterized protein n=1 Tax=Salix udensis TaxID=889485 RepID=A0AAD6KIM6_9ROSI|nr:hypothetical protein OIU84_025039 [Salix udensis]
MPTSGVSKSCAEPASKSPRFKRRSRRTPPMRLKRRTQQVNPREIPLHSAKMTDLEGNIIDVPKPRGCGLDIGILVPRRSCRELFEKPPDEKEADEESVCGGRVEGGGGIRKEARKGAKEVVSVGVEVGGEVLFEEEEERERESEEIEREFAVHFPLLDENEIVERMVLEKKKIELSSKYASDSLMEEQAGAKVMLNIHR